MSSPFSNKFMDKKSSLFMNYDTPLEGNAFIKAKIDAEKAGKDSFVVDGKSHPVQMHGKVQDKIDKARKKFERKGEEGDFYEMNQDLYTELSKAKKSHSDKGGKDPEQESAERDESMSREMNEPSPNQKKKM